MEEGDNLQSRSATLYNIYLIYLFIYLFTYLFISLFIYLLIYLFIYCSIHTYTHSDVFGYNLMLHTYRLVNLYRLCLVWSLTV